MIQSAAFLAIPYLYMLSHEDTSGRGTAGEYSLEEDYP